MTLKIILFILYASEGTTVEATKTNWVKRVSPSKDPSGDFEYF